MTLRMPDELVARARRVAEGRGWVPPVAVPAASLVLLRDGTAGLEVLLMQRPGTMAFAPGMHVFPGGRVDLTQDSALPVRGGLSSGPWAADEDLARAIVVAAVREAFEEAGVLVAADRSGRLARPEGQWQGDRRLCEAPGGFARVLARRRLHVEADLLVPIAHWVTPEVETRRYDTRFLAAALPAHQSVDRHPTETESAQWLTPAAALTEHDAGRLAMLAPTTAVLTDLSGHRSVGDALQWARARQVLPVMPRPVLVGEDLEWMLVHAYSGEVLGPSGEPAGSEERGLR